MTAAPSAGVAPAPAVRVSPTCTVVGGRPSGSCFQPLWGLWRSTCIPRCGVVYISFTDWNLIANRGSWVGADNYDRLFNDRQVWESLKITFRYTVINIVSQTILAVAIAVLMDRLTKSVTIRGILLLPWLIPNVIVALLWVWMLDGNLGIVNDFLGSLRDGSRQVLHRFRQGHSEPWRESTRGAIWATPRC